MVDWQILLLAISANLDDLSIGFAMGLRRPIPVTSLIIIGGISGLTMLTGLSAGQVLRRYLPPGSANVLSAVIFAGFGAWFVWDGIRRRRDTISQPPPPEDGGWGTGAAASAPVHVGSAVILGLGLGINSLGLGLSGGMAGFPMAFTAFLTASTSLIFVYSGSRFGGTEIVRGLIGDRAEYISGGLMLFLAAAQLI